MTQDTIDIAVRLASALAAGIRTADRQNMQKLAEKLRAMQAILEFRISPIGD